jgi:ABC-type nitrate/sulfonate/bicarbonate transport system permease component
MKSVRGWGSEMTFDQELLVRAQIPAEDERPPVGLRLVRRFRVVAVLLLTVALWAIAVRVFEVKRFIVPSPELVIGRFFDTPEFVIREFMVTLLEASAGFGIAATLGVGLAILLARSALLEELLYPYLNIIRVTPSIAIAPLLVVWFGHTPTPHIIVATIISFFPIVVTTLLGLRSADPELINLMATLNASPQAVFRKVRLPNSLPYLFASFRISAPLAVIGALVGEFAGGTGGMGNVLIVSRSNLDTPMSFLMIVLSGFLGILFYGVVVAGERRLIRWHPSVQLD